MPGVRARAEARTGRAFVDQLAPTRTCLSWLDALVPAKARPSCCCTPDRTQAIAPPPKSRRSWRWASMRCCPSRSTRSRWPPSCAACSGAARTPQRHAPPVPRRSCLPRLRRWGSTPPPPPPTLPLQWTVAFPVGNCGRSLRAEGAPRVGPAGPTPSPPARPVWIHPSCRLPRSPPPLGIEVSYVFRGHTLQWRGRGARRGSESGPSSLTPAIARTRTHSPRR
jgi:hypothetical protein